MALGRTDYGLRFLPALPPAGKMGTANWVTSVSENVLFCLQVLDNLHFFESETHLDNVF
jgi:hypothetical protein